jgi:hypothetical protein
MRQAEVIFNEEIDILIDDTGSDYSEEIKEFEECIWKCNEILTDMIGSRIMIHIQEAIPGNYDDDTVKSDAVNTDGRQTVYENGDIEKSFNK